MASNQQLTPQELQRLIDLYERIDGLSASAARSAANNAQNLGNAVNELERLERAVEDLNDTLGYTAKAFNKIIESLDKAKAPLQFQETLVSNLNSIARETLNIRKGESFANTSKIKDLQREASLNASQLRDLKAMYEQKGMDTALIDDQIAGYEKIQEELTDIEKNSGKINKGLVGTIPSLAKLFGNSKLFGGALSNAYQTTMQLGQGALSAGINFNTLGTFTQALGSNLKSALGPLAIFEILLEQFVDIFKASDKATGNLAKDFNMSYSEASNLRSELNEIAGLTGDINVTTKGLQESMTAVGKALGSNAMLAKEDLVFMTKLREQAGLSNEELVEMEKYTLATGGNLKNNTKNLMLAAKTTALNNGVLLNEKDIMRDISKTSDAVKISIAGGAEALGKAAAQAKSLGLNLDQLNNIAGSLMDFESSINAELEAQLLTGKNINLEQARLYALNNDMEGLSKEIAKNYGSVEQFSKMNRLQQEATAKAVGMSREELAKTLTDAEALKGLQGDQAKNAQAALNAARARGMSEEQIAEAGIDNLMNQQDLQEKFNASVEKLKEIFVGVAQSLMPILDTLSAAFKIVGYMVAPFAAIMDIAGKVYAPLKGIVGLLTAAGIAALVLNGSLTFGLGTAITLAAVGAGITYLKSQTSEAAAGPAFAEGGIVTKPITNATVGEKGPEAIIPLNSPAGKAVLGDNKQNNSDVVSELKEIKRILEKTYNLDVAQGLSNPLEIVGTTVATAYNYNQYKTQ